MRLSELISLVVDSATGRRLRGKTLLQKRVYFLSRFLDEDMGYRAHFYGPYSGLVESATADAESFDFIRKETLGFGVDQSTGFEVVRYDFVLDDGGEEVVEYLEENQRGEVQEVREGLNRLEEVGLEGYVELSVAAKVDYLIYVEGVEQDVGQLIAAGREEGWSLNEDEVVTALECLAELGLLQ